MNMANCAFCCVFLALSFTPPAAQEGKVIVVNVDSKDLKRTAYRLRIPVERVKNAREALQEATDLAKRVRPIQTNSVSQLGNWWITFYRSKAESSIKGLVSDLRLAALEAKEPHDYTNATSAAGGLLTALAQLDPEQALEQVRRWPEPSKSLGPSAQNARTEMENRFRQESATRVAYTNPEAALELLSDSGSPSYESRAQIAEALAQAGRKDEALKIIDQAIAELGAGDLGLSAVEGYVELLQSVARLAPDRFPEAFKLLLKSAAALPAGGTASVKVGEKVLALDTAEALTLNLLMRITDRPGAVTNTLDTLPSLKLKLDTVGGIDNVLTSGVSEINYPPETGLPSMPMMYGPGYNDPQMALYSEMRAKMGKNPGLVRSKLADMGGTPEQINSLLNLADTSSFEDPDLASIAVETARKLITRLEPAERRASLFARLLHTSRRCDGEVDPELLKQGFLLVAELREKEKDPGTKTGRSPARSDPDQLEKALVSESAIDNFDLAMRYVRSIPDEQTRLSMLIAVVARCRRPF